MQAFPSGISQIPGPNQKPKHLHFKVTKGSERHSFSGYILKHACTARQGACAYICVSVTDTFQSRKR